jgi:hypothetical protein
MKRRNPSIFPALPDKRQKADDTAFAALLVGGTIMVGVSSAIFELLAYLGWYVPHVLSLSAGLFLGIVIGVMSARTFNPTSNQPDE